MQVPVNFAILVAVSSPNELRDWILDANQTDQDAFLDRYMSQLLSGELAVTATIELWQVALRFCKTTLRRLTQALDGNPDNKTLLDLVTLYENYIVDIHSRIRDFDQLSERSKLHCSEPNANTNGSAKSGPSAADAAKSGPSAADAAKSGPSAADAAKSGPSAADAAKSGPSAADAAKVAGTAAADAANSGPSGGDAAKVAGAAAAAAVAAPLAANAATVGVVSALGFQAGGVAAGSTAASMMSAAAVANGGGVAAGSTVAVMQSIGATGLAFGPVGWVAAGVVGAAIGTAVGVKYLMNKSKETQDDPSVK